MQKTGNGLRSGRNVLTVQFFNRDTKAVAVGLLGKFLVRRIGGREIAGMIVETEAYHGSGDLASHASKGKTKRTEVMFGPPGVFYVYLCYGVHWMLNVVTRQEGFPAAVLIRGLHANGKRISGPGNVARFLHVTGAVNRQPATRESSLWFEDRGVSIARSRIKKTPRIGVSYAGPVWSQKKLRFLISPAA